MTELQLYEQSIPGIAQAAVKMRSMTPEQREELRAVCLKEAGKETQFVYDFIRKVFIVINHYLKKSEGNQEMKVDDIKIYPCFAAHEPKPEKMQQKERYFEETGALQSQIILDGRGNLIDGYTSYLIAKARGIENASVQYGQRQIVRASHKPGGKMYAWELPGLLIDRVFPGDKVLVSTERGARIVIVTAVEDYAGQEPEPLRMVIRVRKRAGNRREEYINKINQQLSTIKDTWILDQIYRVTVNIMN